MSIRIQCVSGKEALTFIDKVAELRISIFKDFPYLYEGDIAYESDYLSRYIAVEQSLFVLAFSGEQLIGVSTGMPLKYEMQEIRAPFLEAGLTTESYFYFGESLLKKEYRGKGIGHRFFDEREAFAATIDGIERCTFCSVIRTEDHFLRPKDYRSNDLFWTKRGYSKNGLICELDWKDVGNQESTLKSLEFWERNI